MGKKRKKKKRKVNHKYIVQMLRQGKTLWESDLFHPLVLSHAS